MRAYRCLVEDQRDDSEERLPRRDEAFPAAWVRETSYEDRVDGFVGVPHVKRPLSAGRLVTVVLLGLWLSVSLVSFIARLVLFGVDTTYAFGFLFLAIFEVVGWSFIVHLIRHR